MTMQKRRVVSELHAANHAYHARGLPNKGGPQLRKGLSRCWACFHDLCSANILANRLQLTCFLCRVRADMSTSGLETPSSQCLPPVGPFRGIPFRDCLPH